MLQQITRKRSMYSESSMCKTTAAADSPLPMIVLTKIFFPPFRLSNGAEFLLQAHDDSEMNQWVSALQAQCQTGSGGGSRSMTLPASSQKDETKRKSFFTLKKK